MFLRTSQVLTLVSVLASAAFSSCLGELEKPKILVGPASFAQAQSHSFTLESTGNVGANTTYSVSTDKPSWFTSFPSTVVILAGQNSVTFNATYVGGQSGAVSFSAWNADGTVTTPLIPAID